MNGSDGRSTVLLINLGVLPVAFFVRDCVRCGVKLVHHKVIGESFVCHRNEFHREVAGVCANCRLISIYDWDAPNAHETTFKMTEGNIDGLSNGRLSRTPIRIATTAAVLSEYIPGRVAGLFREANECRQMTWYEAAGAMYRKTLDVATKHIYDHDLRLKDKIPAQALRVRIKSLGEMRILEEDIVELADVAALDGNDAAHDTDPYTKEEAEALEDLTLDLLDRLFVRPAKIAAVKAKQIAAGLRQT